jgi:cytosine/adenosine deaminase-related metal-dependent hydrolase
MHTPYFESLAERIRDLGGMLNAHVHLDRASTFHDTVNLLSGTCVRDATTLSLAGKHALIPRVHASSMYQLEALDRRVSGVVDQFVAAGTRRVDTVVDVTADVVGRTALDRMLAIRERNSGCLDLWVGAYSPLGFRDDEPQRWDLLAAAARQAQFIGLLPERDDRALYPQHIGYEACCRRGLLLAAELEKPIHIHVDQSNLASESGGETLLRLVLELGLQRPEGDEPMVWLIHLISPSAYDEPRFEALADGLAQAGIGVICCPSAAISMRQIRPVMAPTHNSIARVLDLLAAGVNVRLGSDNICDITSPMGTPDLMDELLVLGNALRYYDIDVLARLAAGVPLTEANREWLGAHLAEDRRIWTDTAGA